MVARRISFLLSEYPTPNHVYLAREIAGLSELGWDVQVVSIRVPTATRSSATSVMPQGTTAVHYALERGVIGVLAGATHYCLMNAKAWEVLLRAISLGVRGRDVFKELWYALELLSVARLLSGTIVHAHFVGQFAPYLAILFPGGWSITLHGPDEFRDQFQERVRHSLRHAAMVRLISAYGRAQCEAIGGGIGTGSMKVVRLGLPVTRMPEPARTYGGRRLLTVGRLSAVKAQHHAILALAEVRRRGFDAVLTIVGEGDERRALEEMARREGVERCVRFAGWLSSDDVLEEMKNADVFVLPSLAEGIPLVLMEAMWQGCVCIATPVGGVPELVEHGIDGFTVPVGEPSALASAIIDVFEDAELPRQIHASAQCKIRQQFDLGTNLRELSDLLLRHHPLVEARR